MSDDRAILNRHLEYTDGLSRGQRWTDVGNALKAMEEAREAERAAIVAWLLRAADRMDAAVARSPENRLVPSAESLAAIYRQRADAISRGDHLTKKQGA